jgi:hypothetical protein
MDALPDIRAADPDEKWLSYDALNRRFPAFPFRLVAAQDAGPSLMSAWWQSHGLSLVFEEFLTSLGSEEGAIRPLALTVEQRGLKQGLVMFNDDGRYPLPREIALHVPVLSASGGESFLIVMKFSRWARWVASLPWDLAEESTTNDPSPLDDAELVRTLGPRNFILWRWLRDALGVAPSRVQRQLLKREAGIRWIVASNHQISIATGLTKKQVASAAEELVVQGYALGLSRPGGANGLRIPPR